MKYKIKNYKPDSDLFMQMMEDEKVRLRTIIKNKNQEETIKFATITLKGYRSALLNKDHFASSKKYKYKFIASCLVFRRYLKQPQTYLINNGDIMPPDNTKPPTIRKQKSISRNEMKTLVQRFASEPYLYNNVDYIIAIAQGGNELGKMFATALRKPMFIVDYSSKAGKGDGKGKIIDFPTIRWKNLLLVDDILDSGHTINDIQNYYKELGCNIQTFVLYYYDGNECKLENIAYNTLLYGKDKPWIVFPWEKGYADSFNVRS